MKNRLCTSNSVQIDQENYPNKLDLSYALKKSAGIKFDLCRESSIAQSSPPVIVIIVNRRRRLKMTIMTTHDASTRGVAYIAGNE